MEISGSHSIKQSPQTLWFYLNDPEILARITPGLTDLESIGTDKFKAISVIKIGPVKASFEGILEMKEKTENKKMAVTIKQDSKIGNVNAVIEMVLTSGDGETTINYKGEAKMAGKLATMGQRIVESVVTSLSKQFFVNLENEFKANK